MTGSPALQAQYAEAVAFWGEEPAWCASVALSEAELEGEWGHADIPTRFGDDCGVVVRPGLSACQLTATMRHEVGHLLGYGHSTDPASPMYGGVAAPCDPPVATEAPAPAVAGPRRPKRRCASKCHRWACIASARALAPPPDRGSRPAPTGGSAT